VTTTIWSLSLALIACAVVAYLLHRRRRDISARPVSREGFPVGVGGFTPQPLKPRLQVEDWDGYSGLQAALCVKLTDGTFVPIIEAGTVPPASRVQTLSTARADQEQVPVVLYSVVPGATNHAALVQELLVGPVPRTGEDIRPVDLVCTVDEDGTVWTRAEDTQGHDIPCSVMIRGERRIPVRP